LAVPHPQAAWRACQHGPASRLSRRNGAFSRFPQGFPQRRETVPRRDKTVAQQSGKRLCL